MPELLFHYTSIESLLKILQGDGDKITLRATHANFMNDPEEFEFANSIISKTLEEYEADNQISEKKSENLFGKGGIFGSFAYLPGEPFILSFSEHQDELSMWRAYGYNGNGVCIGLDMEMLKAYSKEVINTSIVKCEYRQDVIESHLKKYWRKEYNNFKIEQLENGHFRTGFSDSRLFFSMPKYGFSAKSPAYSSEAEWRLCTSEFRSVQFKTRGNLIVPFIEHKFVKSIIKRIVLGPSLNSAQVMKGLKFFLESSGFGESNVILDASRISYRQV
jgi:hypothetical protein